MYYNVSSQFENAQVEFRLNRSSFDGFDLREVDCTFKIVFFIETKYAR